MAQYIDKDAVVAEIDRRIKNLYPKEGQGMVVTKILKDHYEDLHSFIDTLEVIDVEGGKNKRSPASEIDTDTCWDDGNF